MMPEVGRDWRAAGDSLPPADAFRACCNEFLSIGFRSRLLLTFLVPSYSISDLDLVPGTAYGLK